MRVHGDPGLYLTTLFHITGGFGVADFAFGSGLCALEWSFIAGFIRVDRAGVGSAVIDVIALGVRCCSVSPGLDLAANLLRLSAGAAF